MSDEGGPLICNGKLSGILTFLRSCEENKVRIFYSVITLEHNLDLFEKLWRKQSNLVLIVLMKAYTSNNIFFVFDEYKISMKWFSINQSTLAVFLLSELCAKNLE